MKNLFLVSALLLSFGAHANSSDSSSYFSKKAQAFRFMNLDSIRYYAKKTREYGLRSNDPKGSLAYHNIMGVLVEEQGDYDRALLHYDTALAIAIKIKDSTELARTYHQIGVAHKERSAYNLASENLTLALKIAETIDDSYLVGNSLLNLATVYTRMGKISESIAYSKRSYELAMGKSELSQIAAGSLIEMGNNLTALGKYDTAIVVLEHALEILGDFKLGDGVSVAVNNLGALYYFKGEFEKAIIYFQKSVELAQSSNDQKNIALGLMNIGDTYSAMKKYTLADGYLNKSLSIFKSIRHLYYIRDNYECLSRLEKSKGNLEKTLEYTNLYHAYKDSILNEATNARIAELQTQYETEQKEQEINLLKAESDVKELQIARTQLLIFAILVSVLLLAGIAFYLFKKRELKLRLERESAVLIAEEKERTRISRDLHDNLGAQLSYLITNMEWIADHPDRGDEYEKREQLKTLSDAGRQAMLSLRQTIWAISQQSLDIEEFSDRYKQFVLKMVEFNPNMNVRFQESFNSKETLSPAVALNLFRICQEAFHNALKHSRAKQVEITFESNSEIKFFFSIKDDGIGFDQSLESTSQYGLKNMIARADESDASLEIVSAVGAGTTIKLSLAKSLQ